MISSEVVGGMAEDRADLDQAYEQGKQAGQQTDASNHDCPFTQDQLHLRIAWLDGFSDGRWASGAERRPPHLDTSYYGSGIASIMGLPNRA